MENASSALLGESTSVTVAGITYPVNAFSVAKVVLATDLIREIGAEAGITNLLNGGLQEAEENVLLGRSQSFVGQLLQVVPDLLQKGVVPLYKLLGLILTSRERMYELDVQGKGDLNQEILDLGKRVAYLGTLDEARAVVAAGLELLANEPIVQELPKAATEWALGLVTKAMQIVTQLPSTSS